jgi:hypothetical protein
MIEKKIKYDINIEKPSKTKPVKQGGVFNYLGKQKTVNAPVKWRSSKDHPIAHLSYITKDEQKILIDLNLYGSLKGKPNRGPFGLPSLQGSGSGSGGDGGSSGGDSGGPGDSGPGGSDEGSGHGGPGPGSPGGESTGDANDQGGTVGPGDTSSVGPSNEGFGIGPNAEAEAAESAAANTGITGAVNVATAFAKDAIANAIDNPVATAVGIFGGPLAAVGFNAAKQAYSNYSRGVTAPDDYSQATESVQSGPSQAPSGGGISTIQAYAPLYNPDTGNPTMDAYIRQLRVNLGLPV